MGIVDKTLSQQFKPFNKLGTKLTFFGIAKTKTKSLQIQGALQLFQGRVNLASTSNQRCAKSCTKDVDGLTKILNLLICLHRPLHTSATDQECPPNNSSKKRKLRKKVSPTTVSPVMGVESDFGPSQTPANYQT